MTIKTGGSVYIYPFFEQRLHLLKISISSGVYERLLFGPSAPRTGRGWQHLRGVVHGGAASCSPGP